ncbi:MAG: type I 3-dehydroquinate dehydratase, partial [Bacteroidales bacterium]|nr:type I 3-dehydroquinate dehydratase [Bacteroidales bacterium]
MICTCIQHKTLEEIFQILERVEMAEIRLDRCPLSDADIEELFSSCDLPLIATCRVAEAGEAAAERRLRLAIEAGAKYADLEIEAPTPVGKRLRRACVDAGTIMIRSYHNYDETPSAEVLAEKVSLCRRFGGEIVKVVTMARSEKDWETVQKLYGEDMEGQLVAFCMGAAGRASRLECLRFGAPHTYACLTEDEAIAPGQIPVETMAAALYKAPFKGAFHNLVDNLPASKSFAQRAILAAALAEGESRLHGYSPCADSTAAIAV